MDWLTTAVRIVVRRLSGWLLTTLYSTYPHFFPSPPQIASFCKQRTIRHGWRSIFCSQDKVWSPSFFRKCVEDPIPPPLKLHLFCNKEPFSLAEDKIAVPRKNYGTHSSSRSAWRIPYAERMQYLHVISYDTPGLKKRWSLERMTGRRKLGPTTIYKQVYGPAEGQASHPRTSSSNSWKSREGRIVHQKAKEGWNIFHRGIGYQIENWRQTLDFPLLGDIWWIWGIW